MKEVNQVIGLMRRYDMACCLDLFFLLVLYLDIIYCVERWDS